MRFCDYLHCTDTLRLRVAQQFAQGRFTQYLRAELGFKPFDLQPHIPDQCSPQSIHFQLYFISSPHLLCHCGSLILWQLSHGKFCSSWICTFFPTSYPSSPPSETEGPKKCIRGVHILLAHPLICVSLQLSAFIKGSVLGSSDLVA